MAGGKPMLTIAMLGKGKGGGHGDAEADQEMEDTEGSMEMPDGFEDAARQAFDAAKGDDFESFSTALHDAIRLCC
jgi:hypothetical protein